MGKGHRFTIAKTEPDKMMVFGWANVATRKDGTQVEDLQGDVIDPEELEKAAYDHVLRFRSAGERHNPNLRGKGRLIESCVFTKEKQAAMGIPPGVLDEAWWVGYKIDDPDAWAKIKNGEYQMFSVEGKGRRETIAKSYAEAKKDVEKRSPRQRAAKRILGGGAEKPVKNICFLKADGGIIEFKKFNPYHDRRGRFASADGTEKFHSQKRKNYGRIGPIPIVPEAIEKIPYVEIPEIGREASQRIHQQCKDLLREAAKHPVGTEVGAICDLQGVRQWMGAGENKEVSIPPVPYPHITIHNHPSGLIFSEADINTFIFNGDMGGMLVAGNSGNLYAAIKKEDYDGFRVTNSFLKTKSKLEQCLKENDLVGYIQTIHDFLKGAEKYGLEFIEKGTG